MQLIDPDGDIILFIPDAPPEGQPRKKQKLSNPESPWRLRVSSKHLALASAYFKKRLGPKWPEGKELASKGSVEIPMDAPGCDFDTLLIIMNIFHLRSRQIPENVKVETLLNLALATDYLQCHEAVEGYGIGWSRSLMPELPNTFSSDTRKWILIAHTFRWKSLFERTTMLAQRQGLRPFDCGSLPIPKSVKGT